MSTCYKYSFSVLDPVSQYPFGLNPKINVSTNRSINPALAFVAPPPHRTCIVSRAEKSQNRQRTLHPEKRGTQITPPCSGSWCWPVLIVNTIRSTGIKYC